MMEADLPPQSSAGEEASYVCMVSHEREGEVEGMEGLSHHHHTTTAIDGSAATTGTIVPNDTHVSAHLGHKFNVGIYKFLVFGD